MGLSCDCGYDDYEWYYTLPEQEYSVNISCSCYGCRKPLYIGDIVRHVAGYEVDEEGEECKWWIAGRVCEECSDLYDSLTELGFCLSADKGFISSAIAEYRELIKGK